MGLRLKGARRGCACDTYSVCFIRVLLIAGFVWPTKLVPLGFSEGWPFALVPRRAALAEAQVF